MKKGELLPEFFKKVEQRLEKGDYLYGDKAFFTKEEMLITEMQEELIDIVGWAYPLWFRLEVLKGK